MAEDLRRRGQQRDDRRLVDVAECRVESAYDEIQLVAEEPVMGIADEMREEDEDRGDDGNRPRGAARNAVWHAPDDSAGAIHLPPVVAVPLRGCLAARLVRRTGF